MSIGLGINLATGNQVSVFEAKVLFKTEVHVLWSNHLKSRKVMRDHHDMSYRALINVFSDKVDTGLMLQVELLHL